MAVIYSCVLVNSLQVPGKRTRRYSAVKMRRPLSLSRPILERFIISRPMYNLLAPSMKRKRRHVVLHLEKQSYVLIFVRKSASTPAWACNGPAIITSSLNAIESLKWSPGGPGWYEASCKSPLRRLPDRHSGLQQVPAVHD